MQTLNASARLSKDEIQEIIQTLPATLTGRVRDKRKIRRVFLANFRRALYERIHKEFLLKSKGGTDSAGIRWKKLKPSTIARKLATRSKRGIASQDQASKRQTNVFDNARSKAFSELRSAGLSRSQASERANQIAWSKLAQTKTGDPSIPINIETTRLIKSLSPGRVNGGRYIPPTRDQIIDIPSTGFIPFGSKVPYAIYVRRVRRRRSV